MEPVHPTDIKFWYALPIITGLFILAVIYTLSKLDMGLIMAQITKMRELTGFLVEWL